MSQALRARVWRAMGAHSMGMAITLGTQLASLPLFLAAWSAERYGLWLLLSALPAYLGMADVGMVTAAGNRMAMAMGANDRREAQAVFQSAQLFMALVCGGLALVLTPLVLAMPWSDTTTADERQALLLLIAGVLVAFLGGLSDQLFRATQRAATGALLGNFTRLAEWVGWMGGLWLGGSFTAVALGGLMCRVLGTLATMALAARDAQGLRWGFAHASLGTVRQLAQPAVAFMVFPLANALSFQGLTLLVGALLGPAAVAVFNTYRTLARTTVQATAIFSHSLWPEFSRLHGQGDGLALHAMARRSAWLGTALALGAGTALYAVAPWLLHAWTHGRIAFDAQPFGLLAAYAVIGSAWHVPRVLLMATNQHGALALWSLLAAALGVALALWWCEPLGLPGAALAMLLSEAFIAGVGACLVLRRFLPNRRRAGAAT